MNTRGERRFQPAQFLALSFVVAIAIGTILLLLPLSTKSGHISLIDAFFTATSAVCVTGLIVQDTATYFSPAGKIIIMGLFQLGGLGIMTFSTLILLVAGKKVSIKDSIIIKEGFHYSSQKNVKSLIINIFLYALTIELAGSIFLFIHWHGKFSGLKAVFLSVFHSISAFCNAGFSLFSDSFESFRSDTWVNLTFVFLIVLGGIGFLVLQEGKEVFSAFIKKKKNHISLHTKLVLSLTFCLIVIACIVFMAIEWNNSLQNFTLKEKILTSIFQVITPRTAGFNTMNLNTLSYGAVFLLMSLMFIGASPGSTGGGIKTSTIGVILAFIRSKIKARDSVSIFCRTLPFDLITKAFTVVTLSISVIFVSSFFIFLAQPGAGMKEVFFETFSAFGTVGLSLGLTQKLSVLGKIVIIMTMYIGRIGPLTLLYAFSHKKAFGKYEYAEESVMIG